MLMYRKGYIHHNKKAQVTLELCILVIIISVALLCMTVYLKRAFQGKYKQTADDLGEQYSPLRANIKSIFTTDKTTLKSVQRYDPGTIADYTYYETMTWTTDERSESTAIQGYP